MKEVSHFFDCHLMFHNVTENVTSAAVIRHSVNTALIEMMQGPQAPTYLKYTYEAVPLHQTFLVKHYL